MKQSFKLLSSKISKLMYKKAIFRTFLQNSPLKKREFAN